MGITTNLRDQHQRAIDIIKAIEKKLLFPAQFSKEIKSSLTQLTGLLRMHLTAEDRALYPKLINDQSMTISSFARKSQTEMGDLAQSYLDFSKKWTLQSITETNAQEFSREARQTFQLLKKRIEFENNELYPLLENQMQFSVYSKTD